MKKGRYPRVGETSYPIVVELSKKPLMGNAVESLAEVNDYHVRLDSIVERSCQLVYKSEKLSFTAPLCPETVLAVVS